MIANFFLQLGLLEFSAMTWLFPGVALFFGSNAKTMGQVSGIPHSFPRKIEILIPAHEDATIIGEVVQRFRKQIDSLLPKFPEARIIIHVGADTCLDDTAKVAFRAGARVSIFSGFKSRWKTLKALVDASEADWIIVAEPAVRWPEDFLEKILSQGVYGKVLAIDPSRGHGALGKVEDALRNWENRVGGPVQFRPGAWIFEASSLRTLLRGLDSRDWYSLGSVLPLGLRLKNPLKTTVTENRVEFAQAPQDLKTRFREMMGNLQWIRYLLPPALNQNPRIAFLALRHAAQVFWVYGWIFTALGLFLNGGELAILIEIVLVGSAFVLATREGESLLALRDSALVSMAAPLFWVRAGSASQIRWK